MVPLCEKQGQTPFPPSLDFMRGTFQSTGLRVGKKSINKWGHPRLCAVPLEATGSHTSCPLPSSLDSILKLSWTYYLVPKMLPSW